MPEGTPFENHVQQEKKERLYNQFGMFKPKNPEDRFKVLPKRIVEFFEENGYHITPETMRKGMQLLGSEEKVINGTIPDISTEGLEEHLNKFPDSFASPIECVKSIANYIRENMSYDLLVVIQAWDEMVKKAEAQGFEQFAESIIQTVPMSAEEKQEILTTQSREDMLFKLSKLYQYNGKRDISEQQMERMNPIIDSALSTVARIDIKSIAPKVQEYYNKIIPGLHQLKDALNMSDKGQIQNILACTPQLAEYITSFSADYLDISLIEPKSIGEYLKDTKVGVCRHIALIAKMLYSRLQDRISPSCESELIYVVNHDIRHAYNLLMRTEKDNNGHEVIKKEYFDITAYIVRGEPIDKKSEIYGKEGESWVQATTNGQNDNAGAS